MTKGGNARNDMGVEVLKTPWYYMAMNFIAGADQMYYVYILANRTNKVLYTGVTNNLERRLYEHRSKFVNGFAEKYNVNKLVYFDTTNDVRAAIEREKQIKGWIRRKKDELIESMNPEWRDLSEDW